MTKSAPIAPIESHAFHAPAPGPNLLVFGAIHGNEICGPQAIVKLIGELQAGTIKLLRGSITFVPVANPPAYARRVRYVEKNLNRIFRSSRAARSIEARLANQLCRLVDHCDALLDIHSTTAEGRPFLYLDYPTRRNRALARALGTAFAVTGWPEFYATLGAKRAAFDTPCYAAGQGKDVVLIECGQHQDKAAAGVAYTAILRMMRHYGLVTGAATSRRLTEVKIYAGYFRGHAEDRLAGDWRHLDPVRKGAALIHFADGTTLTAPRDSYIIMPKATAPVGEDWLYLAWWRAETAEY